jgi:hypothetical protein
MKHRRWKLVAFIGIVLVGITVLLYAVDLTKPDSEVAIGVTFSKVQAEQLGLDWKETFLTILDGLRVKHIRLVAYWNDIEKIQGEYDFSDVLFQLEETKKRNVDVVMTIGHRVPRWPECFAPEWAGALSEAEFQDSLLTYIGKLTGELKRFENISHWQLENEPFLAVFGICPSPNEELLERELATLKEIDNRPVIITDSGELGLWTKAGKLADAFGTTMYKKVWHKYLGFFEWYLPAVHYKIKHWLFVGEKPFYVMELQAEPWEPEGNSLTTMSVEEQLEIFDSRDLERYLKYARKAGFTRIYLWGAEWWRWLKVKGEESLWNAAEEIFS